MKTRLQYWMPIAAAVAVVFSIRPDALGGTKDPVDAFIAEDGPHSRRLGNLMATDERLILVAADHSASGISNTGKVFVYKTNDSGVIVFASIIEPDGFVDGVDFGDYIAIGGSRALISVHPDGEDARVFVYDLTDPAHPVHVGTLPSEGDEIWGTSLGGPLALNGEVALVGHKRRDSPGAVNGGAVYVFDVSDPSTPIQTATIFASDLLLSGPAHFGASVAMSGHLALVGAPRNFDRGVISGAAYLYNVSDPSAPVELSKILRDGTRDRNEEFGASVAINGTFGLIGSPGYFIPGGAYGAAYIFTLGNPESPNQAAQLLSVDPQHDAGFGTQVSITRERALVSAPREYNPLEDYHGAVYMFDVSRPFHAKAMAELSTTERLRGDGYSHSIALTNSVALVAARDRDNRNGLDAGKIYVYDVFPCSGDVNVDGFVDVSDISFILMRLGHPDGIGDVTGDSVVDVKDISHVLFRLGHDCL